jgi:hypothetical protein
MNNTQIPIGTTSIEAAEAVVAKRFIGFDGYYCGAGAKAAGASEMEAAIGEQIPVNFAGIVLVESGGTFSIADAIVSDSTGRAVAATTFSALFPSGSTPVLSDAAQPDLNLAGGVLPQAINGHAMEAATASGQYVQIMLGA